MGVYIAAKKEILMGIGHLIEKVGHFVLDVLGLGKNRDPEGLARVKTICASDGVRRVCIYRWADGNYSFQEEAFNKHPIKMCWEPVLPELSEELGSAEAAISDARRQIPWLDAELLGSQD